MADTTLKPEVSTPSASSNGRLESWKEIAAYLKRDLRTVQRWEKGEGLPVHRHMHSERGSVYAFKSELDVWWANGRPRLGSNGTVAALPPARRRWLAITVGAALVALASAVIGWRYRGERGGFEKPNVQAGLPTRGPALRRLQVEFMFDPYAMPSPDGTKLAYSVADRDAWRVMVEDLNSGKKTEFSKNGAMSQAWSRDGAELAFREGQDVKISNVVTGATRVLLSSSALNINPVDWSADGEKILALTHAKGQNVVRLAVVSTRDGSIQPVKNWETPCCPDSTPGFSADGRSIALTVVAGGGTEHSYIYSASGEDRIRLTSYHVEDNDPVWSPDGKYIAFRRKSSDSNDLWAVRITDGKPVGDPFLIKADIGRRVWLRRWTTSGQLEFLQYGGGSELFALPVDPQTGRPKGKPEKLISESPDNEGISWLPGGNSFLFLSRRGGIGWPKLEMAPGKNTEDVEVQGSGYYIEKLDSSPDGKLAAFSGWDAKFHVGVFLIALKTGKVQQWVPEPQLHPDNISEIVGWLPDSRTFVFGNKRQVVKDNWEEEILAVGFDSHEGHEIGKINGWGARLSRDGKFVAYTNTAERSIEVLAVESQKKKIIVSYPQKPPLWPDWSPDGTQIVYQVPGQSGSPNQLWVVPASGGQPTKLLEGSPDAPYPWEPRWSPDGKRIAYTSIANPAGYQLWAIEGFLPAK